jgi:hypothetical protein
MLTLLQLSPRLKTFCDWTKLARKTGWGSFVTGLLQQESILGNLGVEVRAWNPDVEVGAKEIS